MSCPVISTHFKTNGPQDDADDIDYSASGNGRGNSVVLNRRQPLAPGQCVNGYQIVELVHADAATLSYSVRCLERMDRDAPLQADNNFFLRELFPAQLCQREYDRAGDELPALSLSVAASDRAHFDKCLERFIAESRSLTGLGAVAGIVPVLRVFEANATVYQLTDKPSGQSLESRIQGIKQGIQNKLSTRELSHLLESLLGALDRVHSVNVLHRNINPACVFLTDTERCELGGFFAAGQVIRDANASIAQTDAGAANRTDTRADAYAPIELNMSRSNQGCWSDLYALGATLYEAVALVPPAHASDRFERLQSNQSDTYVPLGVLFESVYPARLLEAIDWMLSANIRNRPKSVKESSDFLGYEIGVRRSTRRRSLPAVRQLWRARTTAAAASPSSVNSRYRDTDRETGEETGNNTNRDRSFIYAPALCTNRRIVSIASTALLAAVVVLCAGIYVNNASEEVETAVVADTAVNSQPVGAPDSSRVTEANNTTEVGPEPNADRVAAAGEVRVRRTVQRAPLEGEKLYRFVGRHLKQAERAWREGHLLVPARGSVLRHLEFIIEADPDSVPGNAGINHLLFHFIAELQKAESSGDAVAIRYLNRNIRRVRLRHPASVPKSARRFAALPPPPPTTRMTGVAATSAAPDFTD